MCHVQLAKQPQLSREGPTSAATSFGPALQSQLKFPSVCEVSEVSQEAFHYSITDLPLLQQSVSHVLHRNLLSRAAANSSPPECYRGGWPAGGGGFRLKSSLIPPVL